MQQRFLRRSSARMRILCSAAFIACLMASTAAQAPQSTARAVFEVASVKPSPSASGLRLSLDVGRDSFTAMSRVVDGYVLTIDRAKYPGPGLHPVTIDCATNTLSPNSEAGLFPPDARPRCGNVVRTRGATRTTTEAQARYAGFTFSQFAASLQGDLSRPLKTETDLPGVFDIELTYLVALPPDVDRQRGWPALTLSDALVRDALKNQLGLLLTPGRAAMEFLVVDSIDRPSPD